VRQAHEKMLEDGVEAEYAKAVASYLSCTFDRMAMSHNTLTQWQVGYEKMGNMFPRQALPMVWDYAEPNASSGTVRSWNELFKDTLNTLSHCSETRNNPATVIQSSATNLPYSDNFIDAILTDPPYYDNVPHSHLSDFFYVWLKRTVGHLYPDLFSTPLTPKSNEIVAYSNIEGGFEAGKQYFEDMLKKNPFRRSIVC